MFKHVTSHIRLPVISGDIGLHSLAIFGWAIGTILHSVGYGIFHYKRFHGNGPSEEIGILVTVAGYAFFQLTSVVETIVCAWKVSKHNTLRTLAYALLPGVALGGAIASYFVQHKDGYIPVSFPRYLICTANLHSYGVSFKHSSLLYTSFF